MEYMTLKKVHLFLYSKNDKNNYEFILYAKNDEEKEEKYNHMFNVINQSDNGSIYSISRFLTKNFANVFTDEFISKLNKKEKPETKNDYKDLKLYELWENEVFLFWLDKLSQNLIQYDEIKEEIIYFLEIPFISMDELNSLMKQENKTFIYLNENNYENIKLSDETKSLFEMIQFSKMKEHILNTIKMKEEKKYKIYIILSLKTPGKDQNGFFHFPALFQSLYRKNNEEWKFINVSTDGLPLKN